MSLFKALIVSLTVTFIIYNSNAQNKLMLEDIWLNGSFKIKGIETIQSTHEGNHYTKLEFEKSNQFIVKYEYISGKATDTLFNSAQPAFNAKAKETGVIEDYTLNNDGTKILLKCNSEAIYRHSTRENYFVWDVTNKTITKIADGAKQMHARFSPDGNKVAYVQNNNIFYKDLSANKTTQITFDGEWNKIINGAADWVYEEEFAFDIAYFWSPNSKQIAFYRFDETEVKEFSFDEYTALYPKPYKYKYPKAGEKNSIVSIHVYDLNNNTTKQINLGSETDFYVSRIKWAPQNNTLSIAKLNRLQNKLNFIFANTQTWTTQIVYTEESNTYVETNELEGDYAYFFNDNSFVITSEKSGHNHLYHYDSNGKLIKQLTTGNWDVISIKGTDTKNKMIYYTSAETSPLQKDIYKIRIDGADKTRLSLENGYNDASFNSTFTYFIKTYSNANSPASYSLHDGTGRQIRVIENNQDVKLVLNQYSLAPKEFFNFKTSQNIELNGWIIKPTNFDATKKYPVIQFVYGGPGHNTVLNCWDNKEYLWHQYLAQNGYIVVSVDNRGTAYRGKEFKNCVYKQLGKLETIDQIETAKHLGSLPYVDQSRICIEGWSYGGYLSSLCILKGADYFKTAIAIAPVSNWRFYDSIYTERYLGLPQDNAVGYDDNSPINHVKNLKGNYFIIHGTGDDNVHFQNSVEMANALIKEGKQFDSFYYPNKNHGISGGNTRYHLYSMLANYIFRKV
ncbi:MAG: S9 family peptidase [Bacteroidetes bacterium]|nr:S9 family peptidase [Bacteroidota bacterium]